jgi:hypothetical protein
MIHRYIIWRNNQATTNGYAEWSAGQTLPDAALVAAGRGGVSVSDGDGELGGGA